MGCTQTGDILISPPTGTPDGMVLGDHRACSAAYKFDTMIHMRGQRGFLLGYYPQCAPLHGVFCTSSGIDVS